MEQMDGKRQLEPTGANEALTPLREASRVFRWHDHMALWFSLGVGLLVMQIGAYLVPAVGTRDAADRDRAGLVHRRRPAGLDRPPRLRKRPGQRRPDACHLRQRLRAPAGGAQHRAADRLDHLRDRDHARGHAGHRQAGLRLVARRHAGHRADHAAVGCGAAGAAGRLDGQAGAALRQPLRAAAGGALAAVADAGSSRRSCRPRGWKPSGRGRATAAWACSARSTW